MPEAVEPTDAALPTVFTPAIVFPETKVTAPVVRFFRYRSL